MPQPLTWDLSGYMLTPLRNGREFELFRAQSRGSDPNVLVLSVGGNRRSPALVQRLEHEYALAKDLDSGWAVRPLALARHEGVPVLVLDDPGGTLLESELGRPIEVSRLLTMGIALAGLLRQVHRRGLVHKDFNPANLLVDSRGTIRLTGFGIASRMSREHQDPALPEVIAGTLAYMAPEQTGRMNCPVDSRSDLYSLGVTLYQMSVGALPFAGRDAMEVVHCHIARLPVAPCMRWPPVPEPISAIIMKLLAKSPEERYATAAGVEADLKHCLDAWETHGGIDPFTLGLHDRQDRLLPPGILYGRQQEVELLRGALDRVEKRGIAELALVSGYAGVGKTAVVNELFRTLAPARGLFAAGKFDQFKREIPYATLAQAFQVLVRQMLVRSDAEVLQWRVSLVEALGPNGQFIVNLIPELELVIGRQPPVAQLPAQDAKNCFQRAVLRFIGVFCRPGRPLILFLDDLQWLDAETLELVAQLLVEPEVGHLLLVGAYRDNEVGRSHPLHKMLKAIRQAGVCVNNVPLEPLVPADVGRLVAASIGSDADKARPLAELVFEKTRGNPFFALQFLAGLDGERLLVFDAGEAAWTWDLARISAKDFTDNVVNFMTGKLNRLPVRTRKLLQDFACLDNLARTATLALVHGCSELEVDSALRGAVEAGFIASLEGAYRFAHDRVAEAAYELIPAAERATTHLRIGRRLAACRSSDGEESIFEIVNQLNRGASLIDSQEERGRLAELNLLAAQHAMVATAHATALAYLIAGETVLPPNHWVRCQQIAFELGLARAQCEFVTGEFTAADQRLSMLSTHASGLSQLAAVTCRRVELFTALARADRAVDVCLEYLQRTGINWSPHPASDEVAVEYEQLWLQMGDRPIAQLAALPSMDDPESRATLDVLTSALPPAFFTDQNLLGLVVGRMVKLSLQHGNGEASAVAYAYLGLLMARLGNCELALRFGQLSLDLLEQQGLARYRARVYLIFGYSVVPWTTPLHAGLEWLRRALKAAEETGDITYACYAGHTLVSVLLATGDPLKNVQQEAQSGLAYAQKVGFGLAADRLLGQTQFIRALRGSTAGVGSFHDAGFDEGGFVARLEADPRLAMSASSYWLRKMQAHVFAGENRPAMAALAKAEALVRGGPVHFETAEFHFYAALARAAWFEVATEAERPQLREALTEHQAVFQAWTKTCPENFLSGACLIDAEIARIERRDLEAMHLYERASQSAREQGFTQNEALALEKAAGFYKSRGLETAAGAFLRDACSCYERWGAWGKVRQLGQRFGSNGEEPAPFGAAGTAGRFDIDTLLKAARALSGEIVLDALMDKLVRITVEHAGAERGILILMRRGESHVKAEAIVKDGQVQVMCREDAVSPQDLPESVFNYVVRVRESVILDDACARHEFSDDAYVRHSRPRSVLCLPIVRQAAILGVLYLENNLTTGAFTPGRIAVLELLAAQAAISLDHAYMYADLRHNQALLAAGQQISKTGTWIWNIASGKLAWSEELYSIWGLDRSLPAGPSFEWAMQRIHPDDRAAVGQAVEAGAREHAEIAIDYRIVLDDGSIKHLYAVGQPIVTQTGDVQDYIGSTMDVTDRRLSEDALRDAQARLAHTSRLTTMGELTASIAHEVNQPLAAMVTNAETCLLWLAKEQPDLERIRVTAERIVRDGRQAADVISSIRAILRKAEPPFERLDLNILIEGVLALLREQIRRHDILLVLDLSSDVGAVMGDRGQLQQVIVNLVVNGIEAMSDVTCQERTLRIRSETQGSGDLVTYVEDTGPGLDEATMQSIFEPFFTTKPEGMGMGLSICRSIVQKHGGRLWAAPVLPQGCSFQFTLPPATDQV